MGIVSSITLNTFHNGHISNMIRTLIKWWSKCMLVKNSTWNKYIISLNVDHRRAYIPSINYCHIHINFNKIKHNQLLYPSISRRRSDLLQSNCLMPHCWIILISIDLFDVVVRLLTYHCRPWRFCISFNLLHVGSSKNFQSLWAGDIFGVHDHL